MIDFKLNTKQIRAKSGNITFKCMRLLKEANMETRPLGKPE